MNTDELLRLGKALFAAECEQRGVTLAPDTRAKWGIMNMGKSEPYVCAFGIGPKRDGQKPQAYLFEARYWRDGTLVDFRFPEGTDNKYFLPNATPTGEESE
jgi:hypothetical protein